MADQNFVELWSGSVEKWNAGLTGNSSCQKRFACSRRSHQKHSLRQLAAQVAELFRILEELDDFLQLLLGFVASLDVLK